MPKTVTLGLLEYAVISHDAHKISENLTLTFDVQNHLIALMQ